ncbi:MAG: zinc carboxypeptidase [Planctomycetes bacterium]|nr:zinc carboxypeptidase [Planctomycetota bacterium]
MSLSLLVAGLLATLPASSIQDPAPASPTQPARHLVQVWIRDAQSLQQLLALDLDLAACTALEIPARQVDVIATDADVARLRAAGLEFEVAIRDLEAHHAAELARAGFVAPLTLTPPIGQGAMGGHYTLAQIEAILDSFARDYPNLCSAKASIGRSIEGRNLWMVKISENVGQNRPVPEAYYDAVHHAREPLSVSATLLFMDELLTGYGTDPLATWILKNRQLYFVPVVNPDGYEYNRTTNPNGGGMWRKNRRNNGDGTYGVDLNRNYATGWSAPYGGNSTATNSETYRGTAPFSEPEIQAVRDFTALHTFVQAFSSHTYTDILLGPWGYQTGQPPNAADYNAIGQRATRANGLQHGPAFNLLYPAAGTSIDHHHAVHGSFSWTPELGRSNEGGFWPVGAKIAEIAYRNQDMYRVIALTAGSWLLVDGTTLSEAPGGNSNGRIEPGESGNLVVQLSNGGAVSFAQNVTATLTPLSAGVTVSIGNHDFGKVAKFSSANNNAAPLRFAIPAGFAEPIARLRLAVTGDGYTETREIRVVLGEFQVTAADDFEKDRGFARAAGGTATTGLFERSVTQQTVNGSQIVQPGAQHTPGGGLCWVTDGRAGTSASTYDVDNGHTEVVSPLLDLRHMAVARLVLWYWYVDSVSNDAFVVSVSNNDGQSWTDLLTTTAATTAWTRMEAELALPLTDKMRFKVRAQDLNASLVEGLIDDLSVEAVLPAASTTLLASGRLGTTAQLALNGQTGAQAFLLASAGTADLPVPGVVGNLLLDPGTLLVLPGVAYGTGGRAALEFAIPNDPGLVGKSLYFQSLQATISELRLGNRQTLLVQ